MPALLSRLLRPLVGSVSHDPAVRRAASAYQDLQRQEVTARVVSCGRLLIVAHLFLMVPDVLLLGPAAAHLRLLRLAITLLIGAHQISLGVVPRARLADALVFFVLASGGTLAVGLVVGTKEVRYIYALALVFMWLATSVPMTSALFGWVSASSVAIYAIGSIALNDVGSQPLFASTLFFLAAAAYIGVVLVKTLNARGVEQMILKHQEVQRAEELHDANVQLQKTSEQLRALDRAKSDFFANINHELRTPLAIVMAHLQSADEKLGQKGGSPVAEHLHKARFSALRLFALVTDILDLTRLDMEKFRLTIEAVDLSAMAASIVQDVAELAKSKGVAVAFVGAPEGSFDSIVEADRGQIDRVFINLLTNAVKFTPDGGNVTVRVLPAEDGVVFTVQDSGPGIAAQSLPFIFERGFQETSGPKATGAVLPAGLGLGLSLVKTIVSAHQGTVEAQSPPGQGALFRVALRRHVVLPREIIEQRQRTTAVALERRASGTQTAYDKALARDLRLSGMRQAVSSDEVLPQAGGARAAATLLIVDDSRELAGLLGDILSAYTVLYAHSGAEGLQAAKRSRPDLILTDNMMAGGSGMSLLREVRADPDLRETPVVMVTASGSLDDQRQAGEHGIDGYLSKPFDVNVVRSTVGRLLSRERAYASALMGRSRDTLALLVEGLSHNVLNALNTISGSLTILLQEAEGLSERAEASERPGLLAEGQSTYQLGVDAIERVQENIRALQRSVDDAGAKEREDDSLEAIAQRAVLAVGGRETVKAQYLGAPRVRVQRGQIESVVADLLQTARQAGQGRWNIQLSVRRDEEGRGGVIEIVAGGTIGAAFTAGERGEVAAARETTSGGALGLAMSRMVVRSHGGQLSVDTQRDSGTRFTLWLPAAG